jgi:hypothetical protein
LPAGSSADPELNAIRNATTRDARSRFATIGSGRSSAATAVIVGSGWDDVGPGT